MNFPIHWECVFNKINNGTIVPVNISFGSEADLEKILELGFSEGFKAAHGNVADGYGLVMQRYNKNKNCFAGGRSFGNEI